jgi:hypothetical protein
LGSPVVDGWRRIGPGCCRRAAAADRGWRGRERSNSDEDGDRTGQCVARAASLGSRDRAEVVGWFGRRAESRARRRLSGGGHGRDHSGGLAARSEQQASKVATEGPKVGQRNTHWRYRRLEEGARRWRRWRRQWRIGGAASREEGRRRLFIGELRGGCGFSCTPRRRVGQYKRGVGR